MSSVDQKTLKSAQKIMLNTLIEVDRVCKKHHLNYWLDSGTLLGAARDGAFIPWDDDLDIAMMIEDYRQFCKAGYKDLTEEFFFQTDKTDPFFPYNHAKIRSNSGKIIEKHESDKEVNYNQNIFIDVFPMIKIKNTFFHIQLHKSLLMCTKLFSYKYLNVRFFEKVCISLVNHMHVGKDAEEGKIVYGGEMPYPAFGIDEYNMFPLSEIDFCGYLFPSPSHVDIYLKSLYGDDYMTPPPENKRKTHAHSIEIFNEK